MSDIFELKDIVWFIIGLVIPGVIDKTRNYVGKRVLNKKIKMENNSYIGSGANVLPLSHGTPFFDSKHLVLSIPKKEFYFSMPQDICEKIKQKNPDFNHTQWEEQKSCYWGSDDDNELVEAIKKLNDKMDNNTIKQIIEDQKIEVANMFLKRSSEAFFNGEMYGIIQLKDRREGNNEKAKITIESVKTDYYTHRVMAAVYKRLLALEMIKRPNSIDELNTYYPFLTSMGMNVLLIIENKQKVVLTKRSKQLINMKMDQWHLSMNEAISITDLNMETISLQGCVSRGLHEELGIILEKYEANVNYSDIFMLTDPIEFGILAFVVIDELTEADVRRGYNIAQDAPLESTGNDETGVTFLEISKKKIAEFVNNNNLTDAGKYALNMLVCRKTEF